MSKLVELSNVEVLETDDSDSQSLVFKRANICIGEKSRITIKDSDREISGKLNTFETYVLIDPTESGDRTANLSVIIVSISDVKDSKSSVGEWVCSVCTLKNTARASRCVVCGAGKSQQKKVPSTSQAKRCFVFGYLDTGMTYGKSNKFGKTHRTLDELCEDVFSGRSPSGPNTLRFKLFDRSVSVPHPDDINSADDA